MEINADFLFVGTKFEGCNDTSRESARFERACLAIQAGTHSLAMAAKDFKVNKCKLKKILK